MRVHSLDVAAFGPFAGIQRLDFAELNQAGLFLLTGPTGAGKTSVLDAVCFALYGSVPGERGSAKDLKSHHAGADDAPVVELDVSIRGRRFRVRRSPAWSRPSRRARSGIAERPAQARLSECIDGEWRPVSGRIDEIGHLLSSLLGMSRDQFCQVVLLPQGKFQTFLSAGAKERHDVLEALFETSRFKRIEAWVADRRRACDAALAGHRGRLGELAARVEEANGGPLADPLRDEPSPEVDHRTLEALTATCLRLGDEIAVAHAVFVERRAAAKQAQHELDEAKALVDRQTRYREGRQTLDALDATADQLAARERRVDLARSAAAALPVVEQADRARERLSQLTARVVLLRDSLSDAGVALDDRPGAAAARADDLRDRLAAVEALRPLAAEIDAERRRLDLLRSESDQLAGQYAAASRAVATSAEQTEADDELDAIRSRAAVVDDAARAVRRAEAARDAAHDVATLTPAVAASEAASIAARTAALDAKDAWLTARERRLASSAAILAAELVDGRGCPVCGSVEHPAPARESDQHVGPGEEQEALARLTALDSDAATLAGRSADIARRLAVADSRAGGHDLPQAEAALANARARHDDALAAKAALHDALGLREQGRAARAQAEKAVADLTSRSADAAARLDEATRSLSRKEHLLRASVAGDETVDSLAADLAVRLDACRRLAETEAALVEAAAALAEHDDRLRDVLADSPFESADAVRSAWLSEPDVANAEALNRSARGARAAAERTIGDPVLAAAAACAPPDAADLEQRVATTHAALIAASGVHDRQTVRLARLEALGASLSAELEQLAPLLRARDVAASVAAMCAGTSPDNQTRTRLSHYVLSERLRQVVDAANERLAGIASGRYELAHTMDRGVGDTRGGLSLRVYDSHTGRARDPATLSGGEGFYVSLALALGLADLVRDEIGGLELSTLFVDEGFGMLDADTLDEVMDALDSLRAGGRAVGIVSHLHELRLRIPAHVQVVPSASGSLIGTVGESAGG
jgi:DNA repair protein SbcC/Rad50